MKMQTSVRHIVVSKPKHIAITTELGSSLFSGLCAWSNLSRWRRAIPCLCGTCRGRRAVGGVACMPVTNIYSGQSYGCLFEKVMKHETTRHPLLWHSAACVCWEQHGIVWYYVSSGRVLDKFPRSRMCVVCSRQIQQCRSVFLYRLSHWIIQFSVRFLSVYYMRCGYVYDVCRIRLHRL